MVRYFKSLESLRKFNARTKPKFGATKILIGGKLHYVRYQGRKCYVYKLRKKMTMRKRRK